MQTTQKTFKEWCKTGFTINNHNPHNKKYTEEDFEKEVNEYIRHTRRIHIPFGTTPEFINKINEMLLVMNEGVIKPELVVVTSYDEDMLNKEFKKYNIIFHKENNIECYGYYDYKKDEIHIFYSDKDLKEEIEAMIGHEMVHKEQHKKSKGNYFKQSEKIINKINNLLKRKSEILQTPGGILIHNKELKQIEKESEDLYNYFLYLTPYEKMAYAYQYILMYKNLKPNEIINKLKQDLIYKELIKTNDFKKYLAMYYLIKQHKINT